MRPRIKLCKPVAANSCRSFLNAIFFSIGPFGARSEKILKETIKFKFMIVLPIITLPFFLALDFQTVRSSLRSLAYLWFGLTILLLIYKYRDDVYHFCQHHITLCSNSNRRSRCRCRCSGSDSDSDSDSDSRVSRLRSNQTGRVSRIKKSPVEVRYDILKNKGVIIDGDNELKTTYDSKEKMKKNGKKIKTKVAMDKMIRCIETRGNIHGYYAAIKKYKHLYESDQMEMYGNENEDNQKKNNLKYFINPERLVLRTEHPYQFSKNYKKMLFQKIVYFLNNYKKMGFIQKLLYIKLSFIIFLKFISNLILFK